MSEPKVGRVPPTGEQARALDVVGSSVALSAGAGCGKTFVLAERFVRALEGPEARPLGRVVALTFTNKAARELRDRIRRECRLRVAEGADPARWRGVLRGLGAARIGTFHSFCGEVLRRHAVEAELDPGFAVLDESVALSIRERALAFSIRERLSARDPDLIELAVEYGLGSVRESLDGLLANRSVGDLDLWTSRLPQDLVETWVKVWKLETLPALRDAFAEKTKPCLELITSEIFANEKVRARLEEFRAGLVRLEDDHDLAETLEQINKAARVQGLSEKLWPSPEIHEAIKDHFTAIRAEAKKLLESLRWDERATLTAAGHGLMLARLAVLARESYDRAKRSRGGIDNDDLLILTRDLLLDTSKRAQDLEAGSADLILVDEFQDTDPVQSEILEALAGSGLREGKLFLVGDFKQSIYRFRGARPELFRDYRDRFPLEGRLPLSENFRSVPAILDFVNALFAETFAEPDAALRAGRPFPTDGPPAVEFLWAPALEGSPSTKPDANIRRKEETRRLARHLKIRLEAGWMIRDRKLGDLRRANQGDVAFLFRSLSDSSDYQQALVSEGLDFHVVGGSGFYAQQEVLDLINVLTAVDDPLDAVSLAGALRSPFFSISDDALFWLSTERIGVPHHGLELCEGTWLERLPEADRPRASRARRLLRDWRAIKDGLSIAELVDRILTESGYEAALIGEFLGDRKRANARKLVRMARRFDDQGGFTLADFVARLRADLRGATKETQASTTDEEGETIRLMSIHQAKGLEFPIVVIPDLDRKRPAETRRVAFDPVLGPLVNPVAETTAGEDGEEVESGQGLGWTIHRHRERLAEDAEALRLFYVATTRARDALVLSSATDPSKKPTSPAMALLDRRFDRETGLLRQVLPEGWNAPRILVVKPSKEPSGSSTTSHRPRPRLLEVAQIIRDGLTDPKPNVEILPPRPRFVELDPANGLSPGLAGLDRLTRSILTDPRALEVGQMARVATRAARLHDPASSDRRIEQAIAMMEGWARSPEAREIVRSSEVHRGFPWIVRRTVEGASTLFQGRGDFFYRRANEELVLVILSDPTGSEFAERLRLLLSVVAIRTMGWGEVRRARWVRLGEGGRTIDIEDFDEASIDRAVVAYLDTFRRPLNGP